MNRRQMLILMGLLPVVGASVPIVQSLGRQGRSGAASLKPGSQGHDFPDVVLRTQEGSRVRLYDDLLKGRTVLIHFFHTQCKDGACPAIAENLSRLQRLLGGRCGRDVHLYSFSLSPERDTPARLKQHQETYKAGPGWTFLTGAPRDLQLCRMSFGFVDPDPRRDREPTRHTGVVLMGHEPNQRWLASSALTRPDALLDQLDRVAGIRS